MRNKSLETRLSKVEATERNKRGRPIIMIAKDRPEYERLLVEEQRLIAGGHQVILARWRFHDEETPKK